MTTATNDIYHDGALRYLHRRHKMTTATKYAIVTIAEHDGGTMEPGQYWVEMPTSYDPAEITAEDIYHDGALRYLREWEAEDLGLAPLAPRSP